MDQASQLQNIVERIHDAAVDETQWSGAVAAIAEACGAVTGLLYEFDIPNWEPGIVGAHRLDPAFLDDYQRHYAVVDPWSRKSMVTAIGRATCTQELISDADLRRTEFYQDYLRRYHNLFYGLGGVIERTPRRLTMLGVQRSYVNGVFDADCFAIIERVMPHLRHSYRVRDALREAQQMCTTLSETLHVISSPVLVLDGNGRVHIANDAAEKLLAAGDGLQLRSGHVTAAARHQRPLFAEALSRAARVRGGDDPTAPVDCVLRRPRSSRPLILSFAALGTRSATGGPLVAVLADSEPAFAQPLDRLGAALRLTRAEVALLQGLVGGESLSEIADRRSVSVNTLRVQLQRLFQKTGTHRQADLVRFALTALAPRSEEK